MCLALLTVHVCNNYTVLSEADRAQGHIVINARNYRDDYSDLVPGWYRFQGAAGDRMADKCVPRYHCGTQTPGWLSGTHPTVAEGVVIRRVCYNEYYECCSMFHNIRVKNCGAYFVYALPIAFEIGRYCGNGGAGKILGMFLIISFSKVGRHFLISLNAAIRDTLIDMNIGFLL